jgi:glutathione S-transferase
VTSLEVVIGIELEPVPVDIFKGESHTPEFLKRLNPRGLTPVMVDGDVVRYEASANNIYLGKGGQRPARRHHARAV